ncbi:MAG: hypothetical protein IPK99_01610 [Flavobacteriales bacterium]|nr:hypothetical protein [Flavobacteriales bacterium]
MRREALLLFLLAFPVEQATAQSSNYYLDVAGGPAYSFATGTRIVDTYAFTLRDSTLQDGGGVGYQIGLFLGMGRPFGARFRTGLFLERRLISEGIEVGGYTDDPFEGLSEYRFSGKLRTTLDLMQVPLQAEFFLTEGTHVQVGAALGFVLGASRSEKGTLTTSGAINTEEPFARDLSVARIRPVQPAALIGFTHVVKDGLVLGMDVQISSGALITEPRDGQAWPKVVRLWFGYRLKGRRDPEAPIGPTG